jgi:hypothetical protein
MEEEMFKKCLSRMSDSEIDRRMSTLVNGDRRQDRKAEFEFISKRDIKSDLGECGVVDWGSESNMEKCMDQIGVRCTNTGGGSLNTFGRLQYLVEYTMLLEIRVG